MFDTLVALGVIVLQIGIVVVIIGWITRAPFMKFVATYAGSIIAIIFGAATLMSFIYQYGFGYEPCLLCWYQRIAIIPIAILAWTGNLRTNKMLQAQTLILSIAGLAVALFHEFITLFPSSGIDVCGTTSVSCLKLYVYQFGYITIPMMSVTVLAAGLLLVLVARRYPQK